MVEENKKDEMESYSVFEDELTRILTADDENEMEISEEQESKIDNIITLSKKYNDEYKASVYVYDSLNPIEEDDLSPYILANIRKAHKGFDTLFAFFHVEETSIHQITIERQPNCCDCGYRCLFNIYMMGLNPDFDRNMDYFDDFKFVVFVEMLSILVGIGNPRMTVNECIQMINGL